MALYNFVDTHEIALASAEYPAEAMSFNGVYLEDEIDGYRTLSVSGREATSVEITTENLASKDGKTYRRKRYSSRTLKINYQILAKNNKAFRDAYNKMFTILDAPESRVIFHDEPDKYYIGTCSGVDEVESGLNCVTGTINIECNDPFKYAVVPKTASIQGPASKFSVIFTNEGAVPAVLDYNIILDDGPTSFIGIVGKEGVMEFGNREVVDGMTKYDKVEYLATINDLLSAGNDTASGSELPIYSYGDVGYKLRLLNESVSEQKSVWHGKQWATLAKKSPNVHSDSSYSNPPNLSWTDGKKVEIAERTYPIHSDSSGHTSTDTCTLDVIADFRCKMQEGWEGVNSDQQTGFLWISLLDETKKSMAGILVRKTTPGVRTAEVLFTKQNAEVISSIGPITFNPSDYNGNPMSANYQGFGHLYLKYEQGTAHYLFNGKMYKYTDPNNANRKVQYIQAACGQYHADYSDYSGTKTTADISKDPVVDDSTGTTVGKPSPGTGSISGDPVIDAGSNDPSTMPSDIHRSVKVRRAFYSTSLVECLGFYKVDLMKEVVREDVHTVMTNLFKAMSNVFIDGNKGKIYVDGVEQPALEKLGTEYFKAPVGDNEINFSFSSGMNGTPYVVVTVHERWL